MYKGKLRAVATVETIESEQRFVLQEPCASLSGTDRFFLLLMLPLDLFGLYGLYWVGCKILDSIIALW